MDKKNKAKNYIWFSAACLAWFVFRVGARPTRIMYPCQQAAAAQSSWLLSAFVVPAVMPFWKWIKKLFSRRNLKFTLIAAAAIAVVFAGIRLRGLYRLSVLKANAGTIPAMSLPAAKQLEGISLVSFRHSLSVTYGSTPPYDRAQNPAYDLVWQAVEDLGLGSHASPLEDLVNSGDTVLIKINTLGYNAPQFTHPAAVRPVIDMCIAAGAKRIFVGDCGQGFTGAKTVMDSVGYGTMMQQLQAAHPDVALRAVSLGDTGHWRWVDIGGYSSFAGSGYSDWDLASYDGTTNQGKDYYLATDPHGTSVGGLTLGRFAISDTELASTVIINFPKMKTHSYMINTLCIKNHVGSTLGSTYLDGATGERIAHVKQSGSFSQTNITTNFDNDIFWRAIADMNKILLYADKNGNIQLLRQRKYLNVVDAIEAGEVDQNSPVSYWPRCVLAGVDPAAVDAVGSRVMGYNWKSIPTIHKTASETLLPVGIDDARRIMVVGDNIDQINHFFTPSTNWDSYMVSRSLAITDASPPVLSVLSPIRENSQIRIRALITGGYTIFINYKCGDAWNVKQMDCSGSGMWAYLPASTTAYWMQVQDEYFNAAVSAIIYTPSISNAVGYPNPFRPGAGLFTIRYLTDNATIKIYNIAGELVKTISKSGSGDSAQWDGRNDSGEIVASGAYLYVITNPSGETPKQGKIVVVN